jgi:uncharacterized protein
MKHAIRKSLAAASVVAAFAIPATASAQQLKLMSGPQGGAWYPLAGAIQNLVEKNVKGVQMQVLPGAGISNVKGVDGKKVDFGFGNSVSSVDAVHGRAPFDAKATNVCHVGTLYFQYFHVVALADAGIKTVADARGKSWSTQQRGNTAEQMTREVLQVYDLSYDRLSKVSHGSYNDSVSQLRDNQAQVFSLITTIPASSVMDLASARKINVLEVPDDKLRALQKINSGYDKRIIPAKTYPGQDKDVQTIGTWTHLVARCDLPEDLVYNITKTLATNIDALGNVVKAVQGLTPKDMATDVGVPYHRGAMKYYKEVKAM